MTITLYNNTSEPNRIHKSLSLVRTVTGVLRNESNVIHPVIMLNNPPNNFNYCYIAEFNRFYFIDDITSVRNGISTMKCSVDALMSHKNELMNCMCVVDRTENLGSKYLPANEVFVTNVKDVTDIINFSNGLSNNGEFILITAGG